MRSSRDAIRSLIPSRSMEPAESFNSVTAASRNCRTSPCVAASRSTPSVVERTLARMFRAARTRRLQITISIVLASHTVQVTSEAKARPIKTAFTTGSALMYMPHGLRSRGSVAVARILSCASADTGAAIDAAVSVLAAIAAINTGRRKKWHLVLVHAPEVSRNCIPLAPSHTVLLRAPPSCFNMTLLHAANDGQRHGISQLGFTPRGARPPLLGCLQFASGGSAPGDILASPPAPPPHDHAGYGKYQWEDPGQEHRELPDRAAVAALVDPSDPLCRAVSGERRRLTFHPAAAIVDHDDG